MIRFAPSILSADFARLGAQVAEVEQAGADRVHIDVMDGHFVPNISMGPVVVQAIRPVTTLPLEIHLMIDAPERYIDAFVAAGADTVIVHQENVPHLHRVVQQIKGLGKRAGVAINPATPVGTLDVIIDDLDLVLVMTVNPGFSGQTFIPTTLSKIRQVRALLDERNLRCDLEVDGGINEETARQAVTAGADVLVAASAIFHHHEGIAAAMRRLHDCVSQP